MSIPKKIWFVRHGESLSNVARHEAEAKDSPTIEFTGREMDIALSDTGREESKRAGHWFGELEEKPTLIYSSPYSRTAETTAIIVETGGLKGVPVIFDERLREREMGIFDRLTKRGALERYPEEFKRREEIGKFYYRPPGGESWVDVAQRVRGFYRDIANAERILIVTHEVVIRVFRYVLENLTEEQILAIDKSCDVENGAITSYDNGRIVFDNIRP